MIRKVALVGKGYVGGKIYDVLVNSGFEVTVLSRTAPSEGTNSDNSTNTRAVDYDSVQDLTQALVGHDAVVSALAPAAWERHFNLFDAAVDAKVKLFIPSDYTALSTFPELADVPVWRDLATVQDYIRSKADAAGVKWFVLATGPLVDCVLNGSYMYNFDAQTSLITGDGDNKVSMTRGPGLGAAVAKVLQNSEKLSSGPIYAHEVVTTQNEMLKMAEKLSGKQWQVQHVAAEDTLQKGLGMIKAAGAGKPNMFSWFMVIQGSIFSGKYKTAWDGSGNDLLGLPLITKDDLEGLIATRVKGDVLYGGLPWNSVPKPRAKAD